MGSCVVTVLVAVNDSINCCVFLLFPHPAWPLVDGALLVSRRRSPAPDGLLTLCAHCAGLVRTRNPRRCRAVPVIYMACFTA